MPVRKAKLPKISTANYDDLAKIVNACYADGHVTEREWKILLKVSNRIEAIKAKEDKNTAKTTDPIWDSRNSDEPKIK